MAASALRMVELLSEIPEHPSQTTVAELQERLQAKDSRFAVSRRTIERDLQQLAEHFGLQFDDASKPGGWSFRPGQRRVFPGMPDAEAMTLVLAEQMLSDLLPRDALEQITPLVRVAQSKLQLGGKRRAMAWPHKVRIVRNIPQRIPASVSPRLLNILYSAVFEEREIQVEYLKLGAEEPSTYVLNPLGLVLREPVIYLVSTRQDGEKLMHWPLHRFRDVRRTGKPAVIPKNFNLQRELDRGLMGYPVSGRDIKLQLRFPDPSVGHFLLETPLSEDQVSRQTAEGLIVDATVKDTLELRWWILAFGPRVEVLLPEPFREEIFTKLSDALTLYKG